MDTHLQLVGHLFTPNGGCYSEDDYGIFVKAIPPPVNFYETTLGNASLPPENTTPSKSHARSEY